MIEGFPHGLAVLASVVTFVLIARLQGGASEGFLAKVAPVLAAMGGIATLYDWIYPTAEWWPWLGAIWSVLGFGFAHRLTFRVMPLRPAHERWRTLLGGAGLWASILFAGSWMVTPALREVHATALVLLTALTIYAWAVSFVLSSKPEFVMHEGHEAKAHRNCCPRCGRWFDRAEGRAPCTGCGLFVRLETIADDKEKFTRPQIEPQSSLAFGLTALFDCPSCGKRSRFERGDVECPKCGTALRVNWNVHAEAERKLPPAQKVPRQARDA